MKSFGEWFNEPIKPVSQEPSVELDGGLELVECRGCGELGEVNYEGDRRYCGHSPRCCP